MPLKGGPLGALPAGVKARLDELRQHMLDLPGDQLVALVVHGSVVRGDYRPGLSDVDALLVLQRAGRAELGAVARALQVARDAARIETMILTEGEIRRASDVLPLFFDDVRAHHVLVAGRDPFVGLVVSDQHRRLRIEQELRELQIGMRSVVVDTAGSRAALAGALARNVRQARGPLWALLRLRHEAVPADDLPSVLGACENAFGLRTRILLDPAVDLDEALAVLLSLLDRAVDDADRREVADARASASATLSD